MAALTTDRKTLTAVRGLREFSVAAGVVIYEGAIVVVDPSGWARPARSVASNADRAVGRAELRADNTGGSNGAIRVRVRCDEVAYYANSASGDAIANKDIGQPCYAADDQTLSLNTLTTICRVGKIHNVDSQTGQVGVWFDQ